MSSLTRGIRNAFRNSIRSVAVAVILAISIGLALVMLLSLFAVQDRIDSVRTSVGNTITVTPAGIRGFEGGGDLLTVADADTIAAMEHVEDVNEIYNARLDTGTSTDLQSAVDAGSFGGRGQSTGQAPGAQGAPGEGGQVPEGATQSSFNLPVVANGVDGNTSLQNLGVDELQVIDGQSLDQVDEAYSAVIGVGLAEKNDLQTGSTFTVMGSDITVAGIFDADNQFANSSLLMPIDTLRSLSGYEDEVSSLVVIVDSSTNVEAVDNAVSAELGGEVDVLSQLDSAAEALSSLEGVETVARYSLLGALISAAAILFLVMLMIVRERRQEIGVLKAIGASNFKIMKQFITESLTFTLIGGLLGIVLGVVFSNPILEVLVNGNSAAAADGTAAGTRGEGPGGFLRGGGQLSADQSVLENISAAISFDLLLYGIAAAVMIAIVGSAIPSWSIAKIRPAEAMRGE
jgi:putative ABC transport system permease protein